jgi:hypothetical protein
MAKLKTTGSVYKILVYSVFIVTNLIARPLSFCEVLLGSSTSQQVMEVATLPPNLFAFVIALLL